MPRLHDMGFGGGVIDDKAARQGGAFSYWVHGILQFVVNRVSQPGRGTFQKLADHTWKPDMDKGNSCHGRGYANHGDTAQVFYRKK